MGAQQEGTGCQAAEAELPGGGRGAGANADVSSAWL